MRVLLTHPGTQYSYALATQLQRLGLLHGFATCLGWGDPKADDKPSLMGRLMRLLGFPPWWRRRMVPGVPASRIYTQPWPELLALLRLKLPGHNREDVFFRRNRAFQRGLPDRLLHDADVVIGFDTASWILIGRCHSLGKPFILDVSIAHPLKRETIFQTIRHRYPAWQQELASKSEPQLEREAREIATADVLVAASAFTRRSYIEQGIPAAKLRVNPYGTHLQEFVAVAAEKVLAPAPSPGHIRFLFFGAQTARKGLPWLLEVWTGLQAAWPEATLTVAGYGNPPAGFSYPPGVTALGFVHPKDRAGLFRPADVLVFPSFFEGFAQVIIEAMAAGLPVITTPHTIGPDVVVPAESGFIVPPGDDAALREAMLFFLQHPENLPAMRQAALRHMQPFTWEAYGARWRVILEEFNHNDTKEVPRTTEINLRSRGLY